MNPLKHTVDGRTYEIRVMQTEQELMVATFHDGKRIGGPYPISSETALDFRHCTGQSAIDMLVEIAKGEIDSGIVK